MSSKTVLHMEDFCAYWHTNDLENRTPVLRGINFEVQMGEIVSVIG